jgi:hypothetical protein
MKLEVKDSDNGTGVITVEFSERDNYPGITMLLVAKATTRQAS